MLHFLISNNMYMTPTAVFQIFRIREILRQNKIALTENQRYINVFIFNITKTFCDEMMQNSVEN